MASQSGIIGDTSNFGTEIPKTQSVDSEEVKKLRKMAKFSKSQEFKELSEHLTARKDFYQKYLPGGQAVAGQTEPSELGYMWIAANCIIGEIDALLLSYKTAADQVKELDAKSGQTGLV